MKEQEKELRRAPRVICDLWVTIAGVHDAPVRLLGDISLVGVFFEVDHNVGVPGSLQSLRLETVDRRFSAEVMARIVRTITLDDVSRAEPRFGIAFEFMPDTVARFTALQELVSAVLRELVEEPIELESSDLPHAAIFLPRISRMELEANWPVRIGELVQVVFRTPGAQSRIPFEGRVVASNRISSPKEEPAYAVEVELSPPGVRVASNLPAAASSISESVDLIFNVLVDEAEAKKRERSERKEHLVGLLSRISVTSLFSLFELERVSGEMRLMRGDERLHVYVRDGAIIDAVRSDDVTGRDALRGIMTWRDGAFDFTPMEIDREDRLGLTTTSLLLDLAREHDEAMEESR